MDLGAAFFIRAYLALVSLAAIFLFTSDLFTPSCATGALAILAFLVVLRVLIRLFFSIDMVSTRS
jgi:hypothetical protein